MVGRRVDLLAAVMLVKLREHERAQFVAAFLSMCLRTGVVVNYRDVVTNRVASPTSIGTSQESGRRSTHAKE